MSEVIRIFVEKKDGFNVLAKQTLWDIRHNLGMKSVEDLRYIVRYDLEGLTKEEYDKAKTIVLSEPNADVIYEETLPVEDGWKVCIKAQFCAAQILVNIVADHNAVFGLDILLFADFFKIFQIRLATTKVFVCCNKFKIVGRNSRPFKSAFCCNKRKNRICCGNKSAAVFLYEINAFLCIRSKACSVFRNDKLVFVIIGKKVIKLFKVGTADFARCFPENFTVCTAVIILCHSVSTCPHRLYKGVGFDFYNRSAALAER